MVGANYRGPKTDSRKGGRYGEARSQLWRRCTHEFYEFRPFSEEVKPYVSVPGGGLLDYACGITGAPTLVPEEGVAYIECARTPAILHYKGLNVHKVGVLLITPVISAINDLKNYGVNVRPLQC